MKTKLFTIAIVAIAVALPMVVANKFLSRRLNAVCKGAKNMKTRLFSIPVLAIITAICLLAGCGGDDKTEHVHQWGEWIETTAPTCTEAGVETRTCTLDTTHKETRTGAAAIGHQWGEWTETKAPTIAEEGEVERTCTTCGAKETRTIDKLPEEPDDQEKTLTNLFGEGLSTTVTGYFTDTQWNGTNGNPGIWEKIETALNDAFNAGPTTPPFAAAAYKNQFRNVFSTAAWNIKVVRTSEDDEWSKWKATEEEVPTKTFLLGFGILDTDLQQSITDVVTSINSGTPNKE